jgi:hypothetical protein
MLQACEDAREKKLMPEREALVQQCVASGEGDLATCHEKHANYGERTTGAIRMLGKYYDLPECEDAYQARKHYKLNPPVRGLTLRREGQESAALQEHSLRGSQLLRG